jgi:hypothetical protein
MTGLKDVCWVARSSICSATHFDSEYPDPTAIVASGRGASGAAPPVQSSFNCEHLKMHIYSECLKDYHSLRTTPMVLAKTKRGGSF